MIESRGGFMRNSCLIFLEAVLRFLLDDRRTHEQLFQAGTVPAIAIYPMLVWVPTHKKADKYIISIDEVDY